MYYINPVCVNECLCARVIYIYKHKKKILLQIWISFHVAFLLGFCTPKTPNMKRII